MNKYLYLFFLLWMPFILCAQKTKEVFLDEKKAVPINLSEIAEKVIPIPLEKHIGASVAAFLTEKYLFIATMTAVGQFDYSGKLLRVFEGGEYITDIASNPIKEELYVSLNKELKCYDFSGKLKKTFKLKYSNITSYYYDNKVWLLSSDVQQNPVTQNYKISYLDLSTGKETFLSYQLTDKSSFTLLGCFTVFNKNLMASLSVDSMIWNVNPQKLTPVVKRIVKSPKNARLVLNKGFIGKYLFIHFGMDEQIYLYLEDMKNGKTYTTKGIVDDIYGTGNFTLGGMQNNGLLNREGYFYFVKGGDDVKNELMKGVQVKSGPVYFMVKVKP